jgi:hypothetical protein
MRQVNGSTFIALTTVTPVDVYAKVGGVPNPHRGVVCKVTEGSSIMVFQNKNVNGYEAMVKRRLVKEGKDPASFELKPRKWGQRLEGLPIVEHNGQYYLEVIFLKPGRTHYLINGKPIDKKDIIGLKPDPVVDDEQQGGVNDKVIIRTYKFQSIQSITINKDTYNFF